MKRSCSIGLCIFCVFLLSSISSAQSYTGKKMLFVDSYHEGYAWSDGIAAGIREVIEGTGVELKIFHMDTKRNGSEEAKIEAAKQAKALIEEFNPDVVIASDDNASLYLVSNYYRDADLPFVFCGVNWDVTNYGYPYKNATGMVEVSGILQILEKLKPYAKGKKVGYLASDAHTDRKEADNYKKVLNIDTTNYFVQDFKDWKDKFVQIQKEADLLIIGNNASIRDWNEEEALSFVLKNSKIPTGAIYEWITPYALMGATLMPEEQGQWSARTALKILDGTPPSSIKIAMNKKINLIVNQKIADAMGIKIKEQDIQSADKIIK
ncbi:MAG: ABC transporter substrate-binding protein [Deltaproteobacteria bacterium]|nr:ABC transporter substrate-binding protein [Deltaproteobacteria bacterium]